MGLQKDSNRLKFKLFGGLSHQLSVVQTIPMINSLLDIFKRKPDLPLDDEHTLELAVAALMFEVVRSDSVIDEEEQRAVEIALRSTFELSDEELNQLISDGEHHAEHAVDMVQFTRQLNEHFDLEQRADIIQKMWSVAFADNHLDKHEEHIIRRVSDLLHVPHSLYIQAKLKAGER